MKKCLLFILWMMLLLACGLSHKAPKPSSEAAMIDTELEQLIAEVKQDSTNVALRCKLADAYVRRNQDEDANIWYDKVLELKADYVPALLGKGDILIRAGKRKDGYSFYLKSLMLEDRGEHVQRIARQIGQPYEIEQITHGNHDNVAPCFSPDGKTIAFQSNRDGNMEIYILDIETRYERKITDHPAKDEFPVFSPDGKVLAFTSTRDDSSAAADWRLREIYLLELESNQLTRFTNNDADDWYPSFDSKGERLLYVSTRGDIRDIHFSRQWSDIYIHDIKDNVVSRLTESKFQNGSPCFSSNNKWIVINANRNDKFHIYKMDKHGQHIEQLTFGDANDAAPQFAPDNKQIAFFSDRNGNYDVYLMNRDGSNLTQLTCDPEDEAYPKFSPDGKKIIYHAKQDEKFQIFWIDLTRPISKDNLVKKIENKMSEIAIMH